MSEEKAAEKIQASFRGYKTRKSLKNNGVLPSKSDVKESKSNEKIEEKTEEISEHSEKTPKPSSAQAADPDEKVDIDLNDAELEKAATKIQASYRNFTARKKQEQDITEPVENSPKQDEKESLIEQNETEHKEPEKLQSDEIKEQDEENLDDIDLGDPDVKKAALKIQSTFRGYKLRKELNPEEPPVENGEKGNNEE